MLDIAPTELLLVAFVAIVVIGPKDLPKAMRLLGFWVGRARGMMRQFRSGFDAMVREAELEEMERRWKEENARIMREHPSDTDTSQDALPPPAENAAVETSGDVSGTTNTAVPEPVHDDPVMVEKPVVSPAPEPAAAVDADIPSDPDAPEPARDGDAKALS